MTEGDLREKLERALAPVPDAAKREAVERVVQVFRAEHFQGPIAHPRHLAEYEKICPGLADRIAKMAEFAQERHEARADKMLEQEYEDRRRGMYLGFAALMALLVSGTILGVAGHIAVGSVLVGAGVISAVVSPFINGRARPILPKVRGDKVKPSAVAPSKASAPIPSSPGRTGTQS